MGLGDLGRGPLCQAQKCSRRGRPVAKRGRTELRNNWCERESSPETQRLSLPYVGGKTRNQAVLLRAGDIVEPSSTLEKCLSRKNRGSLRTSD